MYFSELQYLIYPNFLTDKNILVTDIFKRVALLMDSNFFLDTTNYYEKTMMASQTLETISNELYGSPYYYWIIMFINNLLNPKWDMPLDEKNFNRYLIKKYDSLQDIKNFSLPFSAAYSIIGDVCTVISQTTHLLTEGRKTFLYLSINNKYNGVYKINYINPYSFSVKISELVAGELAGFLTVHPPHINYYMKSHKDDLNFSKTDIDTWMSITEEDRKLRQTVFDEENIINQNKRIIKVLKPELLEEFIKNFRRELSI